tara:strand:+ start:1776 stop:2141 length:366 start_codon:yes stop_codon:yes gene_type:complete
MTGYVVDGLTSFLSNSETSWHVNEKLTVHIERVGHCDLLKQHMGWYVGPARYYDLSKAFAPSTKSGVELYGIVIRNALLEKQFIFRVTGTNGRTPEATKLVAKKKRQFTDILSTINSCIVN